MTGDAVHALPTPRVTVLMAVFNGLPHLPRAIESVLEQSFRDFELVIVDDGSADDSVACIRSYDDPRIRLVRNVNNLGQTHSLNCGLDLARGAYVARLDQDDVCRADRLERQVAFLDTHPEITVVATWASLVDGHGRSAGVYPGRIDDYGAFVATLLVGKCPFVHSSVMLRRVSIVQAGGYDGRFTHMQDYDLWIRFALLGYRAAVLQEPLITYRLHDGQQHSMASVAIDREYRLAHEGMVERLSNGRRADLLASLLRAEEGFWTQCRTSREVASVLGSLREVLANARRELSLSRAEFQSIRRPLCRRLAGFARMGIARGHRQSLLLLLFALRGGATVVTCPSTLLYPMLFILSPFLGDRVARLLGAPSLRSALAGGHRSWRGTRA